MITVEEQQVLLISIAKRLSKPLIAYAIGGTAMMFLGIKDTTKDIDLVFDHRAEREMFKKAISELGYEKIDSRAAYGEKKNIPEMFYRDDERFDLFLNEVISFVFSDEMKKRATKTMQFSDNLIIKVADVHDLILMKCSTDRVKDQDDARAIIERSPIDFKICVQEAKEQIQLGKEKAAFELGCFLEDLKNELNVPVPQSALDGLFSIVKSQAAKKMK
ncbi:hypothetical protein GOV09_05690 [Candidatus Woesearchaeota archaeon]|nr:hypothetical protein [Candidatus Woesearchaeota archaeon]